MQEAVPFEGLKEVQVGILVERNSGVAGGKLAGSYGDMHETCFKGVVVPQERSTSLPSSRHLVLLPCPLKVELETPIEGPRLLEEYTPRRRVVSSYVQKSVESCLAEFLTPTYIALLEVSSAIPSILSTNESLVEILQ